MTTLTVDLGERSYPIYIDSGILGQAELLKKHIAGNSALIVSNETVAPLYLEKVEKLFCLYKSIVLHLKIQNLISRPLLVRFL